jgi:hypothetical protein
VSFVHHNGVQGRVMTGWWQQSSVRRTRRRQTTNDNKTETLAFVFGLCISAVGVVGILAPSSLVWIAQHSVTSGAF